MKTLRNTLPPGSPARKPPAPKASRAFSSDAPRGNPPEGPARIIKLGPARFPFRPSVRPAGPA